MPNTKAAKQRRHRDRVKQCNVLRNLSATSSRREPIPQEYRVSSFADCTYVAGVTLNRFWKRPNPTHVPGEFFLVRLLPHTQMHAQCDGCVGQHEPTNLTCSQTRGMLSPFLDAERLYNFHNRQATSFGFIIQHVIHPPRARVMGMVVTLFPYD